MEKYFLMLICSFNSMAGIGLLYSNAAENQNKIPLNAWKRHTIDDKSVGADGVKSVDWNQDGNLDWVTGWEQGGVIRIYTHPGNDPERLHQPWPSVTVGEVKAPEDAVFVDLNHDGAFDVLSACEGNEQALFVHWAPRTAADGKLSTYLDRNQWRTERIPTSRGATRWMFCEPAQIDQQGGIDFFSGSKSPNAAVGWWKSPACPEQLEDWKYIPIQKAGWIMSLMVEDVDNDGDLDCWVSDRKGDNRGVYWMENPGPSMADQGDAWRRHDLGGKDLEVMFLDRNDLNGDGMCDTLVATRNSQWIWFKAVGIGSQGRPEFVELRLRNPFGMPHGKDILGADLNGDEILDLIFTSNTEGTRFRPGVNALMGQPIHKAAPECWQSISISGPEGIKFDLIEAVDIDSDGDLDLITCEERDNLGVYWYENPLIGQR